MFRRKSAKTTASTHKKRKGLVCNIVSGILSILTLHCTYCWRRHALTQIWAYRWIARARFLIPTIIRFGIAHVRDGSFTSRKRKYQAEYDVDFVLIFLFFPFLWQQEEKNDYQNFYEVCFIIASNDWKILCVAKDLNEVFYRVLQSEIL